MTARVRKDRVPVYANVGVHAGVAISLDVESDGDGALIEFGDTGPDLILDVADLDSMERLATVVAEGVRLMRARTAANMPAALRPDADQLMGAGVTR